MPVRVLTSLKTKEDPETVGVSILKTHIAKHSQHLLV